MAVYARVRLGPISWVERLDDPSRPPTVPTQAEQRARATAAPWWAWLLVGVILAGVCGLLALPLAL